MSRVLDQFPIPPQRRRPDPKYNWELWLDGRIHAIGPEEYGDEIYVFRNAAHAYAARKGLKIRTMTFGGEFIIQLMVDETRPFRERSLKKRSISEDVLEAPLKLREPR